MKRESLSEYEPKIAIMRSTEAPSDVKENPFYDPEFWGRAKSPEEVYLPDSDEGISFAMAAHEIGHLVEQGAYNDASLDNFKATQQEEQRAWDKGWPYLEKYLSEYFSGDTVGQNKAQAIFEKAKALMMQATELSQSMYVEDNSLEKANEDQQQALLIKRRNEFFATHGEEIKNIFNQIKDQRIGKKTDWEKYVKVVSSAIRDILNDNQKMNDIVKEIIPIGRGEQTQNETQLAEIKKVEEKALLLYKHMVDVEKEKRQKLEQELKADKVDHELVYLFQKDIAELVKLENDLDDVLIKLSNKQFTTFNRLVELEERIMQKGY